MKYDWIKRWEQNDITFHQDTGNPLLKAYWPYLKLKSAAEVFVPLCGKSLDLLWLAQKGYQVTGVELSEIACEAFFRENQLEFFIEHFPSFKRYYNSHIQIYCGDFFKLTEIELPKIDAVYDRAALVALDDKLRQQYAKRLIKLLNPSSQLLLIVYESPHMIQGPPYPLSYQTIKNLFGPNFLVQELARSIKNDLPAHLYAKGYYPIDTFEVVYQLTQRNN